MARAHTGPRGPAQGLSTGPPADPPDLPGAHTDGRGRRASWPEPDPPGCCQGRCAPLTSRSHVHTRDTHVSTQGERDRLRHAGVHTRLPARNGARRRACAPQGPVGRVSLGDGQDVRAQGWPRQAWMGRGGRDLRLGSRCLDRPRACAGRRQAPGTGLGLAPRPGAPWSRRAPFSRPRGPSEKQPLQSLGTGGQRTSRPPLEILFRINH